MLGLGSPLLLLLLPLPLLAKKWFPAYHAPRNAIRVSWFQRTADLLRLQPNNGNAPQKKHILEKILAWLSWVLIVLALAKPQLIQPPISKIVPTRDILLAVDLSGSMETEDFTDAKGKRVNRLTAVKEMLDSFLTDRRGDRVGMIVFGSAPFVQIPFTQDLEACRQLLVETGLRMAGPKTAFGDAIGLAITLFKQSTVNDKVLIALTDGNDTGSTIPPLEAARIAKDNGIVLFVVGIGDPSAAGEERLDEETLKEVAKRTGGRYFHGEDTKQLSEIYTELDKMGHREIETLSYNPRIELFHVPLLLCFALQLSFYAVTFLLALFCQNEMPHE